MRRDVIELRVFVEGVMLPASRAWNSFNTTIVRNGATTGDLTVAAIPGLRSEEWARARVHIFWSDVDIRNETNDWPLLFDGEISSDNFQKSPSSRHVTFGLIGPEIYWEQCKLYFYSVDRSPVEQGGSNLELETSKRALFFGNNALETEVGAPGLTLQNKIIQAMKAAPAGSQLPSLVRRVFKDSLSTTNFFFAEANRLLKLDQRFAVARDDQVSLLYANQQLFFDQIEGNVGAKEGAVPIGEVLRETLSLLRYQMLCNPTGRMVTGGQQYRIRVDQERVRLRATLNTRVLDRLGVGLDELGLTGRMSDDDLFTIAEDRTVDVVTTANLHPEALTDDEVNILSAVDVTDAEISDANHDRIVDTLSFLMVIRDELARLDAPASEVDENPLFPADEDQPKDQIAQFLLLPDTDFALPPVCNVIFPTESMSYGMSRNHLSEPTRSLLSVPVVTDNIRKLYFAPDSLINATLPVQQAMPTSASGTKPPTTAGRITSHFGLRSDPLGAPDGSGTKKVHKHKGMDIGIPVGTELVAFDEGTVVHAGPEVPDNLGAGAGIYVAIKHNNGVMTQYFHMSSLGVSKGQKVNAGQFIGLSGNTGRSTGAHLHFELLVNGVKQDPEPAYLDALRRARAGSNEAPTAMTFPEVSLATAATDGSSRFDDFHFLTPEERIKGIVPMFTTNMDKVSASFERDTAASMEQYFRQYVLADLQKQKYAARSFGQVPMPWSPHLVCGFPALILDPIRSIIAQVESVTHSYSVQGNGEASTVCSFSQPRFWDEGDPYYWRGGKEKFKPGQQIANVPDGSVAQFPSFHLPALVPTNSYDVSPTKDDPEAFGGSNRNRPADDLYKSMLGVPAVPYYFAERTNAASGATVAFNQAVDGLDDNGARTKKTLVGYYESLLAESPGLAQDFSKSYTRRLGASQSEVMETLLKATPGDGGYTGGPFRESIRSIVKSYVQTLNSSRIFRG